MSLPVPYTKMLYHNSTPMQSTNNAIRVQVQKALKHILRGKNFPSALQSFQTPFRVVLSKRR